MSFFFTFFRRGRPAINWKIKVKPPFHLRNRNSGRMIFTFIHEPLNSIENVIKVKNIFHIFPASREAGSPVIQLIKVERLFHLFWRIRPKRTELIPKRTPKTARKWHLLGKPKRAKPRRFRVFSLISGARRAPENDPENDSGNGATLFQMGSLGTRSAPGKSSNSLIN